MPKMEKFVYGSDPAKLISLKHLFQLGGCTDAKVISVYRKKGFKQIK
jgi:hypothetical protein